MDLHLKDAVAVVTGASRGIGLATTKVLREEGALVVAGARDVSSLAGMAGVTAVTVDLAEPDGPARLVQRAIDEHGRVDVLVNNVGWGKVRLDGFLALTDEDFQRSLDINFFSALRASRTALPAMIEAGGGAIVNVASIASISQPDGATIDYGASKAALVNLSKSLAQELGGHGIRVNTVSPGPVSTDLWLGPEGVATTVAEATGVDVDTAHETIIAELGGFATGRITTPEDVAHLIVMLASDRSRNITGVNYVIDSGLIKTT
jgi:NAD(P)-dependent dehydrogenase (short-subunit alcohol dehydrogenase family)